MADYIPKPGSFSLFKNDRKNSDNHPDYAGDGALLDGTPCWINAWLKESSGGKKYFSISLKAKEPARDTQRGGGGSDRASDDPLAGSGRGAPRASFAADLDDEIPFIRP